MPYDNVPEDKWPDMESCVEKVMAKDGSLDKQAAIAICYSSIVEGKTLAKAMKEFKLHPVKPVECDYQMIPPGVLSFADLQAAKAAYESIEGLQTLTSQFQGLVSNILWSPDITDKVTALRILTDEFAMMLQSPMEEAATIKASVLSAVKALGELLSLKDLPKRLADQVTELRSELRKTWSELADEALRDPQGEAVAETLSESSGGMLTLVEADFPATGARAPLRVDVELIQPGWGNPRDNHFYPAEVLKRDAGIFEGAKMYTTDHRAGEKSERTEVSVVEKIIGFSGGGAPIGRIAIFDPEFAEKTRARAALGQLGTLECSILATGTAIIGKAPDGRSGKLIQAITGRESIDWVTRAGAGGRAISLSESASGGNTMPEANETGVPVQEAQPVITPVVITEAVPEPEHAAVLAEARVSELLTASNLPEPVKEFLAERQYQNEEAVTQAIEVARERVKRLTHSGAPFADGATNVTRKPYDPAKVAEAQDRVNAKYFGGRS